MFVLHRIQVIDRVQLFRTLETGQAHQAVEGQLMVVAQPPGSLCQPFPRHTDQRFRLCLIETEFYTRKSFIQVSCNLLYGHLLGFGLWALGFGLCVARALGYGL